MCSVCVHDGGCTCPAPGHGHCRRRHVSLHPVASASASARSVPSEFVRQSPDAANPPTFFLVLSDMSHRVAAAAQVGRLLEAGVGPLAASGLPRVWAMPERYGLPSAAIERGVSCALLQAQQWSDADLADAELLKTAWPRLRWAAAGCGPCRSCRMLPPAPSHRIPLLHLPQGMVRLVQLHPGRPRARCVPLARPRGGRQPGAQPKDPYLGPGRRTAGLAPLGCVRGGGRDGGRYKGCAQAERGACWGWDGA